MTGFLYDSRFLDHNTGEGHPECPERLSASLEFLEKQPWFKELESIKPESADPGLIAAVHDADYLKRAEQTCLSGAPFIDTPDVGIVPGSYDIARLAAGGAVTLGRAVARGTLKNGFALLRPPGHHAEKETAMGFCLFNNAAVLAETLIRERLAERVLILDWDVHHGNGTQHFFEARADVFYMSLHQYPFYPGTGRAAETGSGRGRGTTLNCPMPAGAGDPDYEDAFREKILPAAEAWKPDFVLISAGFDAHQDDPLGGVRLSTGFFGWMTERVMELAARHAGGRIVSLLEGGYNLNALPACIGEHLKVLSEAKKDA